MIMKSGLSLTFALCQLRVRSTWHNPELGIREIMQSFALSLRFFGEAYDQRALYRMRGHVFVPLHKVGFSAHRSQGCCDAVWGQHS